MEIVFSSSCNWWL